MSEFRFIFTWLILMGRANFFVGENGGNRIFKIGVLCLIGIAHLTE